MKQRINTMIYTTGLVVVLCHGATLASDNDFHIAGETFTPGTFVGHNCPNGQIAHVVRGYRCGMPKPARWKRDQINETLRSTRLAPLEKIEVEVTFHHLVNNNQEGHLRMDSRQQQIQVLNEAYNRYNIFFNYKEETVTSTQNNDWFLMKPDSRAERTAKRDLGHDQVKTLNLYTSQPTGGLLGWATWPWDLEGDVEKDGVVVLHSSLPGGSSAPFDLGITAVHEVGHWLGLFHTFQSGCSGEGDLVEDTPSHSGPNFGSGPWENNACNTDEVAPFNNYMNYGDDKVLTEFTKGQIQRIYQVIPIYRPDLTAS